MAVDQKALAGVVTVMKAGGQFQVVIGNTVPEVYNELVRVARLDGREAAPQADDASRDTLLSRFIGLVSGIIHPVLWTLSGAGLFQGIPDDGRHLRMAE